MAASDLFSDTLRQDEKQDLGLLFQTLNRESAFRRARGQVNRLEGLFEEAGVEPPPEDDTRGFIGELFDTLDTGGQFVRGIIAKTAGLENFKDDTLLSAGIRGTQEDLTTGDIFRKTGIFNPEDDDTFAEKAGRGVTSFVGDVLTDPATFLTFGAGFGAKVAAGKVLSRVPVKTRTGGKEIIENLAKSRAEFLAAPAKKELISRAKADALPESLLPKLLDEAEFAGKNQAMRDLSKAAAIVKENKQLKALGLEGPANQQLRDNFANFVRNENEIRRTFNIADDVPLEDLFVPPAVRFTGPFAGAKTLGEIPLLGQRTLDIPLLTPASEKAFEFLGGKLYNLRQFTGRTIDDLAAIPGIGGVAARRAQDVINYGKSGVKLLSRTAQVGGKLNKQILDEADMHRVGSFAVTESQAKEVFDEFVDDAGELIKFTDDDHRAMAFNFDTLRAHQRTAEGEVIKRGGNVKDVIEDRATFNRASKALADAFEAERPGKGKAFLKLQKFVDDSFKEYMEEGVREGFLDHALEGYLPLIMKSADGSPLTSNGAQNVLSKMGKSRFTDHRVHVTLADAAANASGFRPVTNLREQWVARTVAQMQARSSKRMAERIGMEVAISPKTMMQMQAKTISHNIREHQAGIAMLKARGFEFHPTWFANPASAPDVLKAEFPFKHSTGVQVSPDDFDSLATKFHRGGADASEAVAIADELGFDIATKEGRRVARSKIVGDFDAFGASTGGPGTKPGVFQYKRKSKDGPLLEVEDYDNLLEVEGQTSRINGVDVPTPSALDAQRQLDEFGFTRRNPDEVRAEIEQAQQLFKELSPKMVHLGRAGEGALDRAGLKTVGEALSPDIQKNLTPDEKLFYNGMLPKPFVDVLEKSRSDKALLTRLADKAASGDEMAKVYKNIAEPYLGWVKLHKLMATVIWPGYLVRNVGSAQFQGMQSASILGEALNPFKLWETYQAAIKGVDGKLIQEGTGAALPFKQLMSELRSLGVEVQPRDFLELAEGQTEALSFLGTGKLKKHFGKYLDFTAKIENFGRQHLYMQLRKQGLGPTEAATEMSRVMVDYARGKTPFERDVLNNIIFFYSFARGQTANTFQQMIQRPGALTAQLHAVNGVKETLMNNEADLAPDLVREVQTLRSKETVSRYLGKNLEGTDQLLSTVGVPAEDLARFINIHLPREWSLNGVMDAAGTSARRTFQSAMASTNPGVRFFTEYLGANRSFFFDRPLTDKMLRRFPKFESDLSKFITFGTDSIPSEVWNTVDDGLKKLLDGRPNGDGTITIAPERMAILSYLIPGAGRAVTTANFLAKKGPTAEQKLLRAMTGVKITDVTPERSRVFNRARELENELKRVLGTTSSTKIRQQLALIELDKIRKTDEGEP